jgi:hypothetical protein
LFDVRFVKAGLKALGHRGHGAYELGRVGAHHLDGEAAWVLDERLLGGDFARKVHVMIIRSTLDFWSGFLRIIMDFAALSGH